MSLASKARAGRIDSEPKEIKQRFDGAVSTLARAIDEARAFTAFMYDDPQLDFQNADGTKDEASRDKYRALFGAAIANLDVEVAKLQDLRDIAAGTKSSADYVAEHKTAHGATACADYSKRFD